MHRKFLTIGLVVAAVLATGTAYAATQGEVPQLIPPGAPSGYLKINPANCKFYHHEIDVMPTATERYARAEDSRDDVKLGCLTNKINKVKVTAPDTDGVTGYVQVTASGTGATVTATCPAADVVMSGGSPSETTGSWPSSASSWSVARDHLSPKTLSVTAVCAKAAS